MSGATFVYQKPPSKAEIVCGLLTRCQTTTPQDNDAIALPQTKIALDNYKIPADWLKRCHQHIGWQQQDGLHPCVAQIVGFPLQVKLLLQPGFPFALFGLVHIANRIQQLRPLSAAKPLSIIVYFGQLQITEKGWQSQVYTDVYQGGTLVLQAVATQLSRRPKSNSASSSKPTDANTQSLDLSSFDRVNRFSLSSNLGRQYARISGDFNPIHLTSLSASAFGFPGHIAHGMWSKARCLSELVKPDMRAFLAQVNFKKPVFLPTEVELLQNGSDFYLCSQSCQQLHLQGMYQRSTGSDLSDQNKSTLSHSKN